MQEYQRIKHTFSPIYDKDSKILILGSLPSVKSRENGFYYGHPNNRFWKVLGAIYENDRNKVYNYSIKEKIKFLIQNHIALWDVIQECDIIGSSDSSIRNVIPADIAGLLLNTGIQTIYTNGKTADRLYRKYCIHLTQKKSIVLPSTSPANAVYSLERLITEWNIIDKANS